MVRSGLLAQLILSLCPYNLFHMRFTLYLDNVIDTPLETSVQTYQFTWLNIPGDNNFYDRFREELKTEVIIYCIVYKELSAGLSSPSYVCEEGRVLERDATILSYVNG
jgi:hypothetical protein